MMQATLPGTGNAGAVTCLADPVASSSSVEPSQRAERSGSQRNLRLKVRANPQGNLALAIRPDRPRRKRVFTHEHWQLLQVELDYKIIPRQRKRQCVGNSDIRR